jgi:hypothetical protein
MPFDRETDADRQNDRGKLVGRRQGQEPQIDLPALSASPYLDEKRRRSCPLKDQRAVRTKEFTLATLWRKIRRAAGGAFFVAVHRSLTFRSRSDYESHP